MASVAPEILPGSTDFKGVKIRPGSVTTNPVAAIVSNGCATLSFDDDTQFNAFVSGLKAQGTLFDTPTHLTVRFFIRGNH